MEPLRGTVRPYPWGSRSFIAELQGRPAPTPGPEAELWLGAHPDDPSAVLRDGSAYSLAELVSGEPGRWLSGPVLARFGARLPYLLKVLAAEQPLSLQAHPDAAYARQAYAAERARLAQAAGPDGLTGGVVRNYADPYHKPELLVALTPFKALCGFRSPEVSARLLAAFGVAELAPVVARLPRPGGLAAAVRTLLSWPVEERKGLVAAVAGARVEPGYAADAELVRYLAASYPDDPGVLVALLLNRVELAPGEAVWMPAGNLHSYLGGAGVEIMAASDNVLRGGLTGKHVDVPELLKVLRFEVLDDPVVRPVGVAPGVVTWRVPVEDFALHRVRLDAAVPESRLTPPGPRVVLCRAGRVSVRDSAGTLTLDGGAAAVGAADGGALVFSGEGEVYVASAG